MLSWTADLVWVSVSLASPLFALSFSSPPPAKGVFPRCCARPRGRPERWLSWVQIFSRAWVVASLALMGASKDSGIFCQGEGLGHYLVEVHNSGTFWPRYMTRALFDQGARLELCLVEMHNSDTI
ncbi:hypothetical protein B296_00050903 [Ensete ventricosum]|uniref:Uncharacterized protein n=1 Tax=Ensete ventricosum TaxID=4639 RepID=A0A426YGJ7_ENSVE|nr:hypothetical protein B296_00050903 [Ensete ventricosum]